MPSEAEASLESPGPIAYAAAIALIPLVHLVFLFTGMSPVLDGVLPDPDSYMRLVRVTHLYEAGVWTDPILPRSNWPYGELQHWTRPADVLLLSGALVLEPWLGFERALFWWGAATAPLLHMAAALALVWAAVPLMAPSRRLLVVLALLVQIPLWLHGVVGRTDHHMLIILVFVLALGGAVRVVAQPASRRASLLAGAMAGLGIWLSMEFLVFLAVSFAALTVAWVRDGEGRARDGLWYATGLASAALLAVATERPPEQWLAVEYDRISVVHLLVALLALVFWAGASVLERRRQATDTALKRSAVAALGAALAGAVMLGLYPKFFLGPYVDYELALWPISTDITKEVQPLVPRDLSSLGSFMLHLGSAVLAVPYLCFMILRSRGAKLRGGWLAVALGLLAYLPLAIVMRRFSPYAAVLLALVLADLAGLIFERMTRAEAPLRRLACVASLIAVLFGPMVGAGLLLQRPGASPAASASVQGCPLGLLIEELNRPDRVDRAPLAVLWGPNHGPRLLYDTPHAVVTTLFPRNARGQLDAFAIYSATDWGVARDLVAERGIDLVVTCVHGATYGSLSDAPDMLDSALRRGVAPAWLEPVELSGAARDHFRLYRPLSPAP